jgi:hypothetical protein
VEKDRIEEATETKDLIQEILDIKVMDKEMGMGMEAEATDMALKEEETQEATETTIVMDLTWRQQIMQ